MLYPLYESKIQQQKIREQIGVEMGFRNYESEHYKRIQKYSNKEEDVTNVFYKLDHLKRFLPKEIDVSNIQDDYNYGEDCHQ